MAAQQTVKIALIGNPNSGKTSVFNQLTGLRQKTGNFPGITVDKKVGKARLNDQTEAIIIDFPGAYSLYPNAQDERVVSAVLDDPSDPSYPDLVLYVADVTQLEKHFLLLTQIKDLGFPIVLALNMADLTERKGIKVNTEFLSKNLSIPVMLVSGRTGHNFGQLKDVLSKLVQSPPPQNNLQPDFSLSPPEEKVVKRLKETYPDSVKHVYRALQLAHHHEWLPHVTKEEREEIAVICREEGFESLRLQIDETMQRFNRFDPILKKTVKRKTTTQRKSFSDRLDAVLTHRFFGPVIFMLIMVLIFQAIFAWAEAPMGWIEDGFSLLSEGVRQVMPDTWLTGLITDGILAGLGGIMVFIPQIAILFLLITILEEVGYMARAVFMFDKIMQVFGLNGRSIVALISGGACAIPAIMSTRTISNWKERLITILVTPLISCSARIPIYTVLIGFVVPATAVGIFNLQGLAFMGLYLLGIIAALVAAFAFKYILKTNEASFLIIELPDYRLPVWKNVWFTVYEKVKTFVVEAGKIILMISVVLWALASYGPGKSMESAREAAATEATARQLSEKEAADLEATMALEASFAGHLGHFIEPAIRPLGFDWKMGIALITSFAAREVFVGTMATLYSLGSEGDEERLRERMAREVHLTTGKKVYNPATTWSLLIFYAFAMQCMSTLAIVRRETNSWKWPAIQFVFLSALAYLGSLLVFQILS